MPFGSVKADARPSLTGRPTWPGRRACTNPAVMDIRIERSARSELVLELKMPVVATRDLNAISLVRFLLESSRAGMYHNI